MENEQTVIIPAPPGYVALEVISEIEGNAAPVMFEQPIIAFLIKHSSISNGEPFAGVYPITLDGVFGGGVLRPDGSVMDVFQEYQSKQLYLQEWTKKLQRVST